MREHGGEINIVSNEGKGVTLTIRLPLSAKQARLLEGGTAEPGGTAEGENHEEGMERKEAEGAALEGERVNA